MGMAEQRVIVTGGTRGIGKAVAAAFAKQGARVAVSYASDTAGAEAARTELAALGAKVLALRADVADKAQVTALAREVLERWGGIDILVNNAGIIRDKLLLYLDEPDWDRVVDIHLKGTYLCSRAVLRAMIGNRFGRIINIVSPSGIAGRAGQTNYSAAKGGMIAFTRSLSKEVARLGLTVNCVCPGVIATAMTDALEKKNRDELLAMIPMGRFGRPEEVAEAVLFLASDRAAYITGQVLVVDGGIL